MSSPIGETLPKLRTWVRFIITLTVASCFLHLGCIFAMLDYVGLQIDSRLGNEAICLEKEAYLYPTNEKELRDTYVLDRSKLGPRLQVLKCEATRLESQLLERTSDGNKLTYLVAFYADTGEPILDRDLERWLCDNKRLKGAPGQRSKVAYRVFFMIRPQFQREGLAKEILPREEGFFRRWGAREVQADAMYIGRWAWTRPRFGYKVDEFFFQTLQQQYRDWQRSKGSVTIHQAQNISEFPREFLLSTEVSSLPLFKEL